VSPGDVIEERKMSYEVLNNWNCINAKSFKIILNPIGWEINSYPESGASPQEILNRQLLDDADILIAIFWTRIGTPTKEYPSGSIEEVSKHIKAGKPVLIYFSNAYVDPRQYNAEQYSKLMEFKREIRGNSFYKEYESKEKFENILSNDLQLLINDKLKGTMDIDFAENEKKKLPFLNKTASIWLQELSSGDGRLLVDELMWGRISYRTPIREFLPDDESSITECNIAIEQLKSNKCIDLKINNGSQSIYTISEKGYEIASILKDIQNQENNYSSAKNDAIDFISKIMEFNKDINKLEEYFNSLGNYRCQNLNPFFDKLGILKLKFDSMGNLIIQIRNIRTFANQDDINSCIEDIKKGKYDAYLE
jgi:hypothetical protein